DPEEKKAVEEAWKNIQTYRMKKVIVYLEDANFNPMTNVDVSVTQECLGFSLIIGSDTWSPTYWKALFYLDKRVYAASEGIMGIPGWSFIYRDGKLDFDHWEDVVHYDLLKKMYPNSTDFHWFIGPYFSALPEWDLQPAYIDGLSHEEFKIEFKKYLTEFLNRYGEEADYVHVFGEANCWYGNGRRSLNEVLDIIDMETRTIREYAPKSMIVVDLDNIANESLRYFSPEDIKSTWTTEYFVDQMIKRKIDFDIIGLKAYYGSGDRPAEMSLAQFSERLKELSRFGKPLYLYEMGMPSEIDPQDPGYFKIRASWHGRPNEDK
ncbi:MAG: hypothetical protein QXF26_06055, partial [Candidatus Bathyarchaeia archaeon]